jgi:hypothetical protein
MAPLRTDKTDKTDRRAFVGFVSNQGWRFWDFATG